MSELKKIIKTYKKNKKINKKYSDNIHKNINKLREKLFQSPKQTTQGQYVLCSLYEISKGKIPPSTKFDDPEIQWYLHEFYNDGEEHKKLKEEYKNAMVSIPGEIRLPLFTFSRKTATSLIKEVKKHLERGKKCLN